MHAGGQEAEEGLEEAKVLSRHVGDLEHRTYSERR